MASTLTTFDFALKERYTSDKVEDLIFSDRPLLEKLTKDSGFVGDVLPVPIIYSAPQGVGGAFANAQANADSTGGNVQGAKFNVVAGDYFGVVSIGDKVLKASRGNAGAFLENKAAEIDLLYEQMSDALSIAAWRGNGGVPLGQQSGALSGNVATLTKREDCANFEVGMYVVASANDGSSTGHTLAGSATRITAIDREAGTITVSSGPTLASADTYYIFRDGDFAGNTSVYITHGVADFIASSSSPAALFGVTRTTDPQRLAGCRLASTEYAGLDIEQRIQYLMTAMIGRYKGPGPTDVFLNPSDWNKLQIALQSRGQQPMTDETAKFGFMKLRVIGGGKAANVWADRHCQAGTCFALHLPTWKLASIGDLIHPLNGDGLTMLRKSSSNDYEYRLVSYPALYTRAPGWSGRIPV